MKKILFVLQLLTYFVIGNLIFNIVFSCVEILIVNNLGLHRQISEVFMNNFNNSLLAYTIIYFIIIILIRLYDILLIKKMNEKIKIIRGEENHEK